MKKKILSMLLCFTLIICIIPQSTYAQSSRDTSFEEELAIDLKALGLFKGVSDTNFDLNREPTRVEALVMLIRVLGKEAKALNSNYSHPFADVPAWADKYVGYAYENGLTKGTSSTTFGTENANSKMYITFVLRALGYSDTNGEDFTYENPFILAKKSGVLPEFVNTNTFLRADVVTVSYTALSSKLKGSEQTLSEKLILEGVFDLSQYIEHYDGNAIGRKSSSLANTKNDLSSKEIFDSCSPAVICIETYDANEKPCALGSGFFITSNGVAVTNFHVLEDATFAVAKLGGNWYTVMGVLYFDKELDFAVIKTNAANVPYLNIGDSSDIYSGDKIYTIGNPQGLTNTISDGIISNPKREDFNGMIQITAPISSGSSGGALLNSRGEAIGITTGTLTSGQNLNFAVPISEVVNKNELTTIESKYNMFTMEEFATYNGYNVKIEPPKNIRVVRQQNGSAHIQWDKVEGAEYYHFYYQEAGEDTFWFNADDNGNKLKFKYRDDYTVSYDGLENGKIYNVIVTSVKNGVESKDSEILTFVFNALSPQEIAFNNLKHFVLNKQSDTIGGDPRYKEDEVYSDADGSNQYSIIYDSERDIITLCQMTIYDGSCTYSYITLTREEQTYFCSFSFYRSTNKSNTPDFDASYIIDADSFSENSNINFKNINGNKTHLDSYKELAKFMNLEMISFADYIFSTYLSNTGCSMSDFGFLN